MFGVCVADLALASKAAGWDFGAILGGRRGFGALECLLPGLRACGHCSNQPQEFSCLPRPAGSRATLRLACIRSAPHPPAPRRTPPPAGRHWAAVLCAVYTFLGFWFVGGLSTFHAYLVTTNQTTYEHFRHRYSGAAARMAACRACRSPPGLAAGFPGRADGSIGRLGASVLLAGGLAAAWAGRGSSLLWAGVKTQLAAARAGGGQADC